MSFRSRLTFIAVVSPGLLIALLILVRVREPARTEVNLNSERPGATELLALVTGKWWGLGAFFLAIAASQLAPASIAAWVPTILQRDYGYSIAEAGLALGLTLLLSAPPGQIAPRALASFLFRPLPRGHAFLIFFPSSIPPAPP